MVEETKGLLKALMAFADRELQAGKEVEPTMLMALHENEGQSFGAGMPLPPEKEVWAFAGKGAVEAFNPRAIGMCSSAWYSTKPERGAPSEDPDRKHCVIVVAHAPGATMMAMKTYRMHTGKVDEDDGWTTHEGEVMAHAFPNPWGA